MCEIRDMNGVLIEPGQKVRSKRRLIEAVIAEDHGNLYAVWDSEGTNDPDLFNWFRLTPVRAQFFEVIQ